MGGERNLYEHDTHRNTRRNMHHTSRLPENEWYDQVVEAKVEKRIKTRLDRALRTPK